MRYPEARREDIEENILGHLIRDPYRWLEDGESPEVRSWSEAQNQLVSESLRSPVFEGIMSRLVKDFKVDNFSNPYPVHGKYFYLERGKNEEQFVLYMRNGLNGTPVRLVDPHGKSQDNTVTIDFWSVSPSGSFVAYGLSRGGAEMSELSVIDTRSGEVLKDTIPNCRYSDVCWLPDETGFYYTRNPKPGSVPPLEEHLYTKVYMHVLGEDPDGDEMLFGNGRPKDDMIELTASHDGRYLAINATNNWVRNDVFLYDRETRSVSPLVAGIEAKFEIKFSRDFAFAVTNWKADNNRVLACPLATFPLPIEQWREIIPERPYLLEMIGVTADKLVVAYLENACSKLEVLNHRGERREAIPIPPYANIPGISANPLEREWFYSVQSFTFPQITYRADPDSDVAKEFRATENPINPEDFTVTQEWCISKDGTRVPLFVFRKRSVRSGATILWGYGGFAHVDTPAFMRTMVPWMEAGGIFALANLRGNADFGESWHQAAIKHKKQNTFDDFIAASEYLIKEGYASAATLGIMGGSNGGLLVAAVAMQRPELFRAVCSRVPLTDMVRFPLFGMASRWTNEYGDPTVEEDLAAILAWSPYHNIRADVRYPDVLFATAEKDTRVDPMHARKMAAGLQAVAADNEIFLLTEKEAGHGPGKPVKKIVELQAYILAFFAGRLGLSIEDV